MVSRGDEIKTEAERFFREFLQLIPDDFEGITVENLRDLLPFRCSEVKHEMLMRDVTPEEIKKILFAMPNDKSPGPDGYTVEFYKSAWEFIGPEFIISIQSFFATSFLLKGINFTIV